MHRTYMGGIAFVAGALLGGWALAQDYAPGEGAGWTGVTEPEEVIEARRVLMIEIERQMIPIDAFAAGSSGDESGDLEAQKSTAATMEAMLLAFPHLFPPTTDLYEPAVLESPTLALPAIWEDFDSFLAIAEAAESAAAAMAAAEDVETFRAAGHRLRASCDGCHTQFSRPYTPPEVSQEDLEFDFEAVLPPD